MKSNEIQVTITCPHCKALFKRRKSHEEERPLKFCAYCGKCFKREELPNAVSASFSEELLIQAPQEDSITKQIGPYKVISSIGKGGMGEVFLAYDTICGRNIALKQIRSDLINHPQVQQRFLKEATITSQLTHPTIIPIYSIHADEQLVYYTMPYVEGETLRQILRRAKLQEKREKINRDPHTSIPALIRIFLQVCQAAAYAHSKTVLHRDLKPENFMIGRYGQVLILDWGLAKLIDDETEGLDIGLDTKKSSSKITRLGKVVGTIAYMAPERSMGLKATIQTDIYSLGVILYQILTLTLPFQRKNLKEFRASWKKEQLIAPELVAPYREVPHVLSEIAKKCLAVSPESRYKSVDEIIESLERYLEGRSEWFLAHCLDIKDKSQWLFQENILIPEHTAITRLPDVSEWVSVMVAKNTFSENTKIEARVKLGKECQGIGFLLSIPSPIDRHHLTEGYCLWLCAQNAKSGKTKLTRSSVTVLEAAETYLKEGDWSKIAIEKIDQHIYVYINDVLQFSYVTHIPVIGTHIGLISKDANFELQDFSIFHGSQNIQINCLAVPDAFLANKDFDRALTEYQKIATLFPGRWEGREALFRAGITLLEQAKINDSTYLYDLAHDEFHKLRKTPGAPLEYLGKALIYQAQREYEDEVRCFELACRRYKLHPLLQVLEEQIALRLHQGSRQNRYVAYEFAFLVTRYLPHLLATPSTRKVISRLETHWERPLFIFYTLSDDEELRLLQIQLTVAFFLAKPYALEEILKNALQMPVLPLIEIADSIYLLIELGSAELAEECIIHIKELLSVQETKKIATSLELLEAMVHIHNLLLEEPLILLNSISNYPTNEQMRFLFFFTKRMISQGKTDLLKKLLEKLSLVKNDLYKLHIEALIIEGRLWLSEWQKAAAIFANYPENVLISEKSHLFFLYSCFIAHSKGEAKALALYSNILETTSPEQSLLGAHCLAGNIGITGDGWLKRAFLFEKRVLYQQLSLFYYCLQDEEKTTQFKLLETQQYTS